MDASQATTPLKAIRLYCLECANGRKATRECSISTCSLFEYRLGHNPRRAGIGGNVQLNGEFRAADPKLDRAAVETESWLLELPAPEGSMSEACVYCGFPADTLDHVIPRSLRSMLLDVGGWKDRWGRVRNTVPACRECNTIAGNKVFNTLCEKRDYIQGKLRQRYRSVPQTAKWTDEELQGLGPVLQQYVRNSMEVAAVIRSRLRWPGL